MLSAIEGEADIEECDKNQFEWLKQYLTLENTIPLASIFCPFCLQDRSQRVSSMHRKVDQQPQLNTQWARRCYRQQSC